MLSDAAKSISYCSLECLWIGCLELSRAADSNGLQSLDPHDRSRMAPGGSMVVVNDRTREPDKVLASGPYRENAELLAKLSAQTIRRLPGISSPEIRALNERNPVAIDHKRNRALRGSP